MRIDNECIRDILFVIEENTDFQNACYMIGAKSKYQKLKNYDNGKIAYHLRYLKMKELIFNPYEKDSSNYDLTPDGHEFLSNIREDNNWNKIKSVSSSIGFASLKIISAIAEGVATAAINSELGLSK